VRPERAADHSPPSSAVVVVQYSYTSTHPLGHTGPVKGSLYVYSLNKHPYQSSIIHFSALKIEKTYRFTFIYKAIHVVFQSVFNFFIYSLPFAFSFLPVAFNTEQ